MRSLHRRVAKQKEGVEYHDAVIISSTVQIGSAADQNIVLRETGVRPCHAEIRQRSRGNVEISAVSGAQLRINGGDTGKARLEVGDIVEFGNCRIEVLPTPPGFDLALQTDTIEQLGDTAGSNSCLVGAVRDGWFSKTRLSWLFATGILLVTFLVPVTGLISPGLQDIFRNSMLLPSDKLWDTGPLASAHRIPEIGSNCNVCHVRPFRQVANSACLECHEDVRQHVPQDSVHAEIFAGQNCMNCHKEHKEPAQIVRSDQQLCTVCHADAQKLEGVEPEVIPVDDFDEDHPDFRLTMLVYEDSGEVGSWLPRRVEINTPGLIEQSNLKFNHKMHLDPDGVEAPDGGHVMQCSDCHVDDAAGALMRPISMEGQCGECHSLAFDENAPERELPHGILTDVIASLEEYYSRMGLEKQPEVEKAGQRKRTARRPGRSLDEDMPKTVLEWARQEARITAEDIFERTSCNTCHDINRVDYDAETPEWEALPVKLNEHWMPHAHFSHRDHAMSECTDCHEAKDSEKSTDVLMPSIEVCRDCHGGASSKSRLKSTCMTCHFMHNPEMEPLFANISDTR